MVLQNTVLHPVLSSTFIIKNYLGKKEKPNKVCKYPPNHERKKQINLLASKQLCSIQTQMSGTKTTTSENTPLETEILKNILAFGADDLLLSAVARRANVDKQDDLK